MNPPVDVVKLTISVVVSEKMVLHSGTVRAFVTMSGLITVSAAGDIEFINNSFSHMFLGYTRNDLVGKVLNAYLQLVLIFLCLQPPVARP